MERLVGGTKDLEAKYQPCELVQTLPRVSKPFPWQKHFPKISPGEFFKTAAMQRGCCFCDPPYTFRGLKAILREEQLKAKAI